MTIPFILFVSSNGSSFCYFQRRQGWQSSLALQFFLKPHIYDNTMKQPHYHPRKFCRCKLKLVYLAVKRRRPVHGFIMSQLGLSFIICASTRHLPPRFAFKEEPPQVQFSLCTACLFASHVHREDAWILVTNLTEFIFVRV